MPLGLARPYIEHLSRLEAEESLQAVNRAAVAAGTVDRQDSRRLLREWKRAADPSGDLSRPKPVTPEVAEMLGIKFVKVQRTRKGPDAEPGTG